MDLIGLNGKKGAGKDTAGSYLVERYGYERVSFAEPMKESFAALFGVDPALLEDLKNDPTAIITLSRKVEVEPGISRVEVLAKFNVRVGLQRYGTEAHRDIPRIGQAFWTTLLLDNPQDIFKLDPEGHYVITDARFENECSAVRDAGGTIVVIERPGTGVDGDTHASEADLPEDLVDATISNSGTIADLHAAIDAFVYARQPSERTA